MQANKNEFSYESLIQFWFFLRCEDYIQTLTGTQVQATCFVNDFKFEECVYEDIFFLAVINLLLQQKVMV